MNIIQNKNLLNQSFFRFNKSKLLFTICILISSGISLFIYKKIVKSQTEINILYLEKFKNDAEFIFQNYINPLNGIAAAYHISPKHFNAQSFQKSSETRELFKDFKGALGFGFIRKVKASELNIYISKQIQKRPDFRIKHLSNTVEVNDHYVIEMVEPLDVNKKAIGLVISDEINRQQAAEESMKAGKPVITHAIQLVQSKKNEPGFLLFRPIYATANTPHLEYDRMNSLVGWAYAPILASAIVNDIKSKNPNLHVIKIDEIGSDTKNIDSIYLDKDKNKNKNISNDAQSVSINIANKQWVFLVSSNNTGTWSSEFKASVLFLILISLSTIAYFYFRQIEMKTNFDYQILKETQLQVSKVTSDLILLQQHEKLQQAKLYSQSKLSLLGEMAGGIAHEINNPLAIIKGKARMLNLKVDNGVMPYELKDVLIKNIQDIDLTIDRISTIVKGLRSFSRDSEGDPFQKVSLVNILSSIENLIAERIKSKGIEFEITNGKCDIVLNCNKVQIEQVILNLLSNAIYAIENLDDRWIKIIVELEKEFVKIRIVDSGNGISKEISDKMMQPFFTTKPVGQGTGLGLSICKGIIDKHNSKFDYELYEGHTSFIILFPYESKKDGKLSA